jgi:hypothetical protein
MFGEICDIFAFMNLDGSIHLKRRGKVVSHERIGYAAAARI